MIIKLYKIKKECFDDLMTSVTDEFEKTGNLIFPEETIETNSEPILLNGKYVEINIDISKYLEIAKSSSVGYTKFANIGIMLHKDLKSNDIYIPRNLFYEKELWAYLSLTHFKEIVRYLRLKDNENITVNKIKQFYFNAGEISRTGLLFLWVMVDRLNSENDFEITHTAFEFVDPVKAILERTMGKNPFILRAYVQGIINNKKDARFKRDKFRSKIPSHISCYAGVNILDALDYSELVDIITKQQKIILEEN